MAILLKNVTNSIWHAFNALLQEKQGLVNKSKLKVLTANIASILDLYGVEKGLEHYRSTSTLTFEHFRYYLLQEVFLEIQMNDMTLVQLRNYESKIEELCWLVCRKKYTKPKTNPPNISDEYLYKLFRIYCMVGQLEINEDEPYKVQLHSSEAANILQELMSGMGLDYENDNRYNSLLNNINSNLDFYEFLQLLKFEDYNLFNTEHMESLNEVIEEMYQTYIHDIIKKGYLLRRGYLLPTLKEYWFVLQPCELTFYKHQNQKDLCGSIALDQNCMVRPSQSTTQNIIGKQEKFLKFILSAGERTFELAAQDHKSRLQWITALQLAITYSMGKEGYQRELVARRRHKRDSVHLQKQKDELIRSKHLDEVEKTKILLEDEKLARIAAESQARALQIIAREDSRRVAELEDIKITLENLLQDETQAKRDEEIVRALQARVLAEEWEKRDELEQLQNEQRILLEQEREKRMQFEVMQKEKEQNLREAERKLKELEEERQRLDMELKQARIKILHSEETKQLLESRLQIISPPKDGGDRIRRALSFMHPNRERGAATISSFKFRKSDEK